MAQYDNATCSGIARSLTTQRLSDQGRFFHTTVEKRCHAENQHWQWKNQQNDSWDRSFNAWCNTWHKWYNASWDKWNSSWQSHEYSKEVLAADLADREDTFDDVDGMTDGERFFSSDMPQGQGDESDEEPMIGKGRSAQHESKHLLADEVAFHKGEETIYVNNLTGDKEYKVDKAKLPYTVHQLKQCLSIAWGAPKSMQRIVAGTCVLNDSYELHAGMTRLTMLLSIDEAIAQVQARETANLRLRALQDLAKCGLQVDELAARAIRVCLEDPSPRVRREARRCLQSLQQ